VPESSFDLDRIVSRGDQSNAVLPAKIKVSNASKGIEDHSLTTNINYISATDELSASSTVLQFVLVSLCKSMELKSKQAAGLLADNNKYLIHVCVKGVKSNYQKVCDWYALMYKELRLLATLMEKEEEHGSVKITLNFVSAGLYSGNQDVVLWCAKVLNKLGTYLDESKLLADINLFCLFRPGTIEYSFKSLIL